MAMFDTFRDLLFAVIDILDDVRPTSEEGDGK